MLNDHREKVKFVIQFTGTDLSGLLHTFTAPIKDARYNIDDISLATGGGRHTTFISCSKELEEGEDRWQQRRDLRRALDKAVKKKYDEWYKGRNEVSIDPEPVQINFVDGHTHQPTLAKKHFAVYVSVVLNNESGATHSVATLLQDSFTIKDASDSPLFPEQGAEWDQEMGNFRVLWMALEHHYTVPPISTPPCMAAFQALESALELEDKKTRSGAAACMSALREILVPAPSAKDTELPDVTNDSLAKTVEKLRGALEANHVLAERAAEKLIDKLREVILKPPTFAGRISNIHVVDGNGKVLQSRRDPGVQNSATDGPTGQQAPTG